MKGKREGTPVPSAQSQTTTTISQLPALSLPESAIERIRREWTEQTNQTKVNQYNAALGKWRGGK